MSAACSSSIFRIEGLRRAGHALSSLERHCPGIGHGRVHRPGTDSERRVFLPCRDRPPWPRSGRITAAFDVVYVVEATWAQREIDDMPTMVCSRSSAWPESRCFESRNMLSTLTCMTRPFVGLLLDHAALAANSDIIVEEIQTSSTIDCRSTVCTAPRQGHPPGAKPPRQLHLNSSGPVRSANPRSRPTTSTLVPARASKIGRRAAIADAIADRSASGDYGQLSREPRIKLERSSIPSCAGSFASTFPQHSHRVVRHSRPELTRTMLSGPNSHSLLRPSSTGRPWTLLCGSSL